jgi:COP9 signalosome complex subunit 4
MATVDIRSQLSSLEASSAPQGDKAAAFSSLLRSVISNTSAAQLISDLSAFIDTVLSDNVGIVTSRPVLSECVKAIQGIDSADTKKALYVYTLEKLRPKIISFEEQDCNIREALADIHEFEEKNGEAAKVLQGIQLNPHQRQISDEFRVKVYIRIMRNLLEDDEAVSASDYLNRASLLIHLSNDPAINLQFQMCQARILDSKRDFLNACSKYHQLSFSPLVDDADRTQCLSAAMTCAILAGAGPLRSRSLATLYKDDRSPQLHQDYSLLEKMYLDRLLTPKEVDEFAARLRPHQVALLTDGTTVLSKAMIEHNLLGASKLYNNIGVEELGVLLGLSAGKAEEYAARMIEQKRLSGKIDQIERLIYFDSTSSAGGAAAERIVGSQLRRWDEGVASLAQAVENITSMLQNDYPVSHRLSVKCSAVLMSFITGVCCGQSCTLDGDFLTLGWGRLFCAIRLTAFVSLLREFRL